MCVCDVFWLCDGVWYVVGCVWCVVIFVYEGVV